MLFMYSYIFFKKHFLKKYITHMCVKVRTKASLFDLFVSVRLQLRYSML